MLRGDRFFKNSRAKTDSRKQEQESPAIECLPNEMLLPICQNLATNLPDKYNMSLVCKWFREVNEDHSVSKHLTHDINLIIDSLLHDLYRFMVKQRSTGSELLCVDKELVHSIEGLKKQLAAVMKARSFEKIDNTTLDIFSNGNTKVIESNSLLKYGGLLPYVIDSVESFQFLTATVGKSQRNAIEVIFKSTKLSEKNDLTTRLHLMLRIFAELKNKNNLTDKHQEYKEILTKTSAKLAASLSKEQHIIAMQMMKDGMKLSEELYLDNLTNTFMAVSKGLHEQLGDDASYDISSASPCR
ncbi:hypothetical protein [Legionella sp. WA2024007413]